MKKDKEITGQLSFLSYGDTLRLSQKKKQVKKKKPGQTGQPDVSGLFFDNLINLETVSEVLGVAPKTIHNWVYLRKLPYIKVGRKVMFRPKSLENWLNRKEIKSWL